MSSASHLRRVKRKVSDEYKQPCGSFTPQLFRRNRCALCFFDASRHNSSGSLSARDAAEKLHHEPLPEELKKSKSAGPRVASAAIETLRGEEQRKEREPPPVTPRDPAGDPPPVPARDPASRSPRTLRVTIAEDEASLVSNSSISAKNVDALAAELKRANTSGHLPRASEGGEHQVPQSDSAPSVAKKNGESVARSLSGPKRSKLEKKARKEKEKKIATRAERSNSQPSKEGLDDLLKSPSVTLERAPCSPRASRLKKARNRLSTDYLPALLLRGEDIHTDEGSQSDSETAADKEHKKKKERSLFNRIRGKGDSSKSSKIKAALPAAQNKLDAGSKKSSESPIIGYLRISVLLTRVVGKLRELERDGVGVSLKLANETLPKNLVMFSPFQAGLQPSQWLFPVTAQHLKVEELVVTVMNFVSRQTIGLISIPLKGVPFMHSSMTFGVMRSYAWIPVHKLNGSVRIGLKLTKKPNVAQAKDRWTSKCAGGDLDHNTWTRSPQYSMRVDAESLVSFTLASRVGTHNSMGLYVLKLKSDDRNVECGKKLVDEDIESRIESYFTWMQKNEVVDGETYLTPGNYVVVVCTSDPGIEGEFKLSVGSAVSPGTSIVRLEDNCELVEGEEAAKSDGGSDFGDFFDDSAASSGPGLLKLSVDRSSTGGEEGEEEDWDLDLDLPAQPTKIVLEQEEAEEDWDSEWVDEDGEELPAVLAVERVKEQARTHSAPQTPEQVRRGGEDEILTCKLLDTIKAADSKKLQTLLGLAKKEPLCLSAAIIAATKSGNIDLVKACIAHNANINSRDENGCTPLLCAAETGNYEVGKLLCDSGCDCTALDAKGEGALLKASKRGHLGFLRLPWEVEAFELDRGTPSVQVDTPWEVCAIYHSPVVLDAALTGSAGAVVRPQATFYVMEVFIDLPGSEQQALLQLAIHSNHVVQSVVCVDCGVNGRDASVNSHMLVTALLAVSCRLAQDHLMPNGLSLQDARDVCIFMLTSKEFSSLFAREESDSSLLQCNLAGSLGEISSIRGFFDYVDTLYLITADYRCGQEVLRTSSTEIRGSFPQYRTAALVLSDAGYARLSVLLRSAKVPKDNKGDFYFIIRVGDSQHKTKPRRMKEMDSMNAKFTFAVDSPLDEVQVVLFTKTKAVNNLALGGLTMQVKDLEEENVSKRDWHELTAPGKKVIGQVLLEFNYSRVQGSARM